MDLEIDKISYLDGCKVYFKNGGWIIARFSGTEPLLRIFCEMGDPKMRQDIERFEEFLNIKGNRKLNHLIPELRPAFGLRQQQLTGNRITEGRTEWFSLPPFLTDSGLPFIRSAAASSLSIFFILDNQTAVFPGYNSRLPQLPGNAALRFTGCMPRIVGDLNKRNALGIMDSRVS